MTSWSRDISIISETSQISASLKQTVLRCDWSGVYGHCRQFCIHSYIHSFIHSFNEPCRYFKTRLSCADNGFARDTNYLFFPQFVQEIYLATLSIRMQLCKGKPFTREGCKINSTLLRPFYIESSTSLWNPSFSTSCAYSHAKIKHTMNKNMEKLILCMSEFNEPERKALLKQHSLH